MIDRKETRLSVAALGRAVENRTVYQTAQPSTKRITQLPPLRQETTRGMQF